MIFYTSGKMLFNTLNNSHIQFESVHYNEDASFSTIHVWVHYTGYKSPVPPFLIKYIWGRVGEHLKLQ